MDKEQLDNFGRNSSQKQSRHYQVTGSQQKGVGQVGKALSKKKTRLVRGGEKLGQV